MLQPLDCYLSKHKLTRYQVSKHSRISSTTLQRANNGDVLLIRPKILVEVGRLSGKSAGQCLDEIIEIDRQATANLIEP